LSAAGKLSPPTNEIVELSGVTGEVLQFDSKGLVVETNSGNIMRMPMEELQNSDYQELLKNKVSYIALTTFGDFKARKPESEPVENQMRQIWLNGRTLQDKMTTRLVVLEDMLAYNSAVRTIVTSAGYRAQAESEAAGINVRINANMADAAAANARANEAADLEAYDYSEARHAQFHALREQNNAEQNVSVLQNSGTVVATEINKDNQSIATSLQMASVYAKRLAGYGVIVPNSPPLCFIPPLSMRLEVDAERLYHSDR
jgi:hypothetical protein